MASQPSLSVEGVSSKSTLASVSTGLREDYRELASRFTVLAGLDHGFDRENSVCDDHGRRMEPT